MKSPQSSGHLDEGLPDLAFSEERMIFDVFVNLFLNIASTGELHHNAQ